MSDLHVSAFLGAVGAAFLGAGGLVVSSGLETLEAPVLEVPVVDATSVSALAPASLVLVEGRIDDAVTPLEAGLALVRVESARGVTRPGSNDVRFTWEETSTRTQSFVLKTATGPLFVRAEGATLEEPSRVESPPGVVTAGTQRAVGFAPGDAVVVEGSVRGGAAGPAVDARRILGGTVSSVRDGVRRSARVPFVLGSGFGVAGLLALVSAVRSRKQRA